MAGSAGVVDARRGRPSAGMLRLRVVRSWFGGFPGSWTPGRVGRPHACCALRQVAVRSIRSPTRGASDCPNRQLPLHDTAQYRSWHIEYDCFCDTSC